MSLWMMLKVLVAEMMAPSDILLMGSHFRVCVGSRVRTSPCVATQALFKTLSIYYLLI